MIRVKGRYRNQAVELAQPLDLPEGAEVEVEVSPVAEMSKESTQASPEKSLRGTVTSYDDPFGPATSLEDWEALK